MITVYAAARSTHQAPRTCAAVRGEAGASRLRCSVLIAPRTPLHANQYSATRRRKAAKSVQFCPKVSNSASRRRGAPAFRVLHPSPLIAHRSARPPARAPAPAKPSPLYSPRDPRAADLWQLLDRHFPTFQQVYDERFQAKYGFWRPVIERSMTAFLKCGDLQEGFARVRCPDCQHEMFEPFSCKQRRPGVPSAPLPVVPPEAGARHRVARGRRGLLARRAPASGPDYPQASSAVRPLRSQPAGQALGGGLRVQRRRSSAASPRRSHHRLRAEQCHLWLLYSRV